ncbi:CIR protein [Plasmodium chabaudi chabaudi]|uniref:CIR protein n=1 Tax=Plasmodium chabaudi chabaudi TaxID=31271 RepID=A0A077TG16_PLACU|nr:CIR protein [Plasmodium chabaudi chabaudi]SCL81875.1 CIR protein [Plasmodium chabaudi chabaudi]VTZ67121.1 CIR protein [Plasmodium chabaudi chabaudi]|eukprot:XP_016652942.1 CIR protein [Plasmodium chabaudi chabaudi]
MSNEVCMYINKVDKLIKSNAAGTEGKIENHSRLNANCPNKNCDTDAHKLSSAFILLLKYFEVADDLKDDKCAEYAILWLSYKIQQYWNIETTTLKNFITEHIETNTNYNEKIKQGKGNKNYKEFIDIKQSLINMDVKIISKFHEALQILCNMYNEDNAKNIDCAKCSSKASEFVEKYKDLNDDSNVTKDSPYYQVWCTLSTDYDNLKNECIKNCKECTELPTLPEIKESKKYVQDYAELSAQGSEATSSSSSIASKLVPVLSIFVAIPIFLGFAYKHSLFGFDKRLNRQYLREKVKKIKKKMNINI